MSTYLHYVLLLIRYQNCHKQNDLFEKLQSQNLSVINHLGLKLLKNCKKEQAQYYYEFGKNYPLLVVFFFFSHRHGNPQGQESQMRAHPSLPSLQLNTGSLSLLKPKYFMEKMLLRLLSITEVEISTQKNIISDTFLLCLLTIYLS